MKYTKGILVALTTAIVICVVLAIWSLGAHRIPRANNTAPAEDIVTHFYSGEELSALSEYHIPEEGGRVRVYQTLDDISKDFKIECVRDMSVYYEKYPSYVVLMSEDGQEAFIFFDKDSREIKCLAICDGLATKTEMENIFEELTGRDSSFEEWDTYLGSYWMGTSGGAYWMEYQYAVKEGMFIVNRSRAQNPVILLDIDYYSNEELLSDKAAELFPDDWYMPYPLLPIDKQA